MIALQSGQWIEVFNLLLDICLPLGILASIGGVVWFIVRYMRQGD